MMKLVQTMVACSLLVATTLGVPSDARACMPGFAHPQKQVMIFWHDGTEILVWRARVTPGSEGPLAPASPTTPARRDLAWVLVVPSAPLAYHVVENEDFDRTVSWTGGLRSASPYGGRGGGVIGGGADGLNVGETVRVGEYDVTPIQADEGGAAGALNAWLQTHRFPPVNADAVTAYAEEGATFLAVKARLPRGTNTLELRPIAIAFRSAQVVLPVRLSAGEAPFGLTATLVSTRVPDLSGALSHGLTADPLKPHHAQGPAPAGRVSIVPQGNVPAEMRHLIEPITSAVPGFERMLTGSVAVSLLAAQPLTIAVTEPDPTIALGEAVAPNAPASVAHEGHWNEYSLFVLGPDPGAGQVAAAAQSVAPETSEATPATAAAEPTSTSATTSTPTPATAISDDGGLCSASGRPAPTTGVLGLLVVALWLRRRRG